jgi:hypothetical protein
MFKALFKIKLTASRHSLSRKKAELTSTQAKQNQQQQKTPVTIDPIYSTLIQDETESEATDLNKSEMTPNEAKKFEDSMKVNLIESESTSRVDQDSRGEFLFEFESNLSEGVYSIDDRTNLES